MKTVNKAWICVMLAMVSISMLTVGVVIVTYKLLVWIMSGESLSESLTMLGLALLISGFFGGLVVRYEGRPIIDKLREERGLTKF